MPRSTPVIKKKKKKVVVVDPQALDFQKYVGTISGVNFFKEWLIS